MINGLIKCDKYDSFPEHVKTKILNYRRGRAANIVALLKDSGFIATEHNARTAAAILPRTGDPRAPHKHRPWRSYAHTSSSPRSYRNRRHDDFAEDDVVVNTCVPDAESELAADADQKKARRTSRGRVPAPEKGQGGVHIPPGGQPSSNRMAQPARSSPQEAAEEGTRRGRTKGFYTQKDPFTGEEATLREGGGPELLRPHHGMPLVPWSAVATTTRVMMMTENRSFLWACLGPLVRLMSRDPTEMTIGLGQRLGQGSSRP